MGIGPWGAATDLAIITEGEGMGAPVISCSSAIFNSSLGAYSLGASSLGVFSEGALEHENNNNPMRGRRDFFIVTSVPSLNQKVQVFQSEPVLF